MTGPTVSVTRGKGSLEKFLARRRAAMADHLIPQHLRQGHLLDIGCGTFPYFLSRTAFARKIGLDKQVSPADKPTRLDEFDIDLLRHDVDSHDLLPFADGTMDVVTMLAVFEHVEHDRLLILLNEIHRVLKPGGMFIMTTPAGWTGPILRTLKKIGLVSAVEIDEHKDSYSQKMIRAILSRTRFANHPIRAGYFECFMNIWVTVARQA